MGELLNKCLTKGNVHTGYWDEGLAKTTSPQPATLTLPAAIFSSLPSSIPLPPSSSPGASQPGQQHPLQPPYSFPASKIPTYLTPQPPLPKHCTVRYFGHSEAPIPFLTHNKYPSM
ncbi:hypothetical protein Pcinc_030577 [Petrolisthes cinctipes]|uniref:Uncharacterized protein n=1 Tax=Petrolisthes cinctipes TaxID=88211 RepID=A0AAE1K651_PETCI|nr:hypothetical protein Pcinc_030577 [Petrolisthes cinctipes]